MAPVSNPTSQRRRVSLRAVAAVSVLVCAAALLGHAVARGATAAAVPAATFRDPANDVRAADVDLRSISVGKQNGALVVRFTVRKPITRQRELHRKRQVRYRVLGARRKARRRRRLLPALRPHAREDNQRHRSDPGAHRDGQGSDRGPRRADERDARPRQRLLPGEPVGGRSGDADRAASTGPTVWFCLTDRRPRPKWGPCIWPGQVR